MAAGNQLAVDPIHLSSIFEMESEMGASGFVIGPQQG
jgi:hypothetical protein